MVCTKHTLIALYGNFFLRSIDRKISLYGFIYSTHFAPTRWLKTAKENSSTLAGRFSYHEISCKHTIVHAHAKYGTGSLKSASSSHLRAYPRTLSTGYMKVPQHKSFLIHKTPSKSSSRTWSPLLASPALSSYGVSKTMTASCCFL